MRGLLWMIALCLGTGLGCSTGREVTGAGERFACASSSACATGYTCLCGFCQPSGGQVSCLTDAGPVDGGADIGAAVDTGAVDTGAVDTGANDTGMLDAGSGPCNAANWTGCAKGQGCYWNDVTGQAECLSHGTKGLNTSCVASTLTDCARSTIGAPLLCDSVDKKCYPLCLTSAPASCPGGTCYVLQDADKKSWPNGAGICVK